MKRFEVHEGWPEKKVLWLSFVDPNKPPGKRFLGVIVVEVTREEAHEALVRHPAMYDKERGPWLVAATEKCWEAGINPGGSVASWPIEDPEGRVPRMRLLTEDEVERFGEVNT